jgi:hypothetical protein
MSYIGQQENEQQQNRADGELKQRESPFLGSLPSPKSMWWRSAGQITARRRKNWAVIQSLYPKPLT